MKNRKRNITMIAVLLFVCAAVALNWSYNKRWGTPDADMVLMEDEMMSRANAAISPGWKLQAESLLCRWRSLSKSMPGSAREIRITRKAYS